MWRTASGSPTDALGVTTPQIRAWRFRNRLSTGGGLAQYITVMWAETDRPKGPYMSAVLCLFLGIGGSTEDSRSKCKVCALTMFVGAGEQ